MLDYTKFHSASFEHTIIICRKQENLRHYIFPKHDHNIARALKEQELLEPIIEACASNQPRQVRELTKRAGGEWRNEKAYMRCKELHRYEEIGETR